jgi:hypothetical protein
LQFSLRSVRWTAKGQEQSAKKAKRNMNDFFHELLLHFGCFVCPFSLLRCHLITWPAHCSASGTRARIKHP